MAAAGPSGRQCCRPRTGQGAASRNIAGDHSAGRGLTPVGADQTKLAARIELLELQEKIQSQVRSNIDKSQRNYYLQEQMKAIRKELEVVVEPGAKLTRCTVRGPAVIGAGAEIRDAFVGPYTAIGPNCLIDRCEIENSIVLEDSRLERIPVRIADSLIGKNVRIHPGLERPRVHRFLIGDNAEIGIV